MTHLIGPVAEREHDTVTHAPSARVYIWLSERLPIDVEGPTVIEAQDGRGLWVRLTVLTAIRSCVEIARKYGVVWFRNAIDLERQIETKLV